MTTLLIAEHQHQQLAPASLHAYTAAQALDAPITVLVAGYECQTVAEQAAQLPGVEKVLLADNPAYQYFLAENIAALIAEQGESFSHIIAPATTFGKNCLPRAAALLDRPQVSDITKIIDVHTYERPIYAGNAIATVQVSAAQHLVTVRTTAFAAVELTDNKAAIDVIDSVHDLQLSHFVKAEVNHSERPELTNARIVVSGGRGLKNQENFKLIEQLADCLGAAIGASRAAVDAGFIANDHQVGQTGKVVAPDLYIAIGISGAIQHLAGIKDSKIIVAINKDPDAPIFQLADYGLVGDLFQVIPELMAELEKRRS